MTALIKKIWSLFLLLLIGLQVLYAQDTHFAFSHLTLYNNLYAHTLMRDGKGYLWIGSDGLFRYDGVSIKRFIHNPKSPNSLVNNIVKSIVEDKKGRIWVGTVKGISRYDPTANTFLNYEHEPNDKVHPENRLDNTLYIDDTGILWCGNQSGLSRYDEASNRFIYYDLVKYQFAGRRGGSFITGIIDDKKNKDYLWLSSYNGFIHFNKKNGFARYFYPTPTPLTINNILQDSHGRIWLSTWGRGLCLFDPIKEQFSFFSFEENTHVGSDNIVFNIQEQRVKKDSSLFFVSTNKGLALLNLQDIHNIRFNFFYTHQPDNSKSIGGIPTETLIDKQGIIWIATANDVSYILPATQVFRQIKCTSSDEALINSITEEKLPNHHYQYWLSSWYADGLIRCNEDFRPMDKVHLPEGYGKSANSRQISQIVMDTATNTMWIATMDGLFKWNRTNNKISSFHHDNSGPLSLASDHVMSLLLDRHKNLWIGTYKSGLSLLHLTNDSIVKLPEQVGNIVKDKRVFCMYQDRKERLWFGCSSLLLRLDSDGTNWQVYRHQKDNNKSKAEGDVNGITEDKQGNIWIGNDEGLNRFNEKTNDFDLFTTDDGLSDDHIYSLVCDKAGIIWAGTGSGLNAVNPMTMRIKCFYDKDGLASNDVSNALFIKHDNKVVVAGQRGSVTVFDPSNMYRNNAPPPVYITALKLFNKRDNRQSNFPLPQKVKLTYDENYFAIDFIALNLMNADNNKYAYQLTGLDKDWIQSGTEHTATYSNLSAGEYVFRVKASNNDGVWNQKGASLTIIITPPFWKTWWFICLCIITLFIIAYSLYNYRLEQLLRVERLRTKISTDLHDDIGSTLSSISILSELVLNKRNKKQADEMLNEIKDNAISLMEKMDDIVWSINPKNDSLEDLLSRITRFATQLFEAKNIEHSIIIQPSLKDLKLSMEARQHLYLMIKETINNIIKHACCTETSILATHNDHTLSIVIHDNGKGFDMSKNFGGNGQINLKERADKMGGAVLINSLPGKGTTVTITSKIK